MDFLSYKSQVVALANETSAIDVMWLYGSQADGSAHAGSDIDLAVCFNVWIDDPLDRRLRPELLALEWQKILGLGEGIISIVDINQAPIGLAMSVLNYSTILVCKNDMRKMREQQRIMSMWETDLLYHQKHFSQEYLSTEISDKGLNNE